MEVVVGNPQLRWRSYDITVAVSMEDIEKYFERFDFDLTVVVVKMKRARHFDLISRNLHKPWPWARVTEKFGSNWDIYAAYPELPWCYESFSYWEIPTEILCRFSHKPWNYKRMSYTIGVTREFYTANIDKPWDMVQLHRRKIISDDELIAEYRRNPQNITLSSYSATPKIVDALPDALWDYRILSDNENFGADYIMAHPDKPWNENMVLRRFG